jgi:hypothetical protein
LGLALDEPTENDVIQTINGIVVAVEKTVIAHAGTITLDVQGDSLVILGNDSCC